jgi:tripartite-type tricarboxylate transporter receptor subunit TctC
LGATPFVVPNRESEPIVFHAERTHSLQTLTIGRVLVSVLSMAAWCLSPGMASAQPSSSAVTSFPSKPITIVVPFGPGGIADLTARTVGEAMGRSLGQAVVIDNKPSAGSIVGSSAVANAAPDGHTLLLMSNANAVSATMFRKLPFDTNASFVPVSLLGAFDLGLFVSGKGKLQTLQDFVTAAKAAPGKLTVGSIAVGSTQHLSAELFKTVAGVDVVVVPYRGSPAVITALRAGEIDMAFEIVGPMLAQVQSGDVRALAVTSKQRNAALPNVPTVAQSGVAGYDVASWNALAAPAGTPPAVVQRLNTAVREALATPAVQERLGKLGLQAQASTPADMQSHLHREIKRWADVIRSANIEIE